MTVNMSEKSMDKFLRLRLRIFMLIERCLKIDGHHKDYEGTLSIRYPNYFQDINNHNDIVIELQCYPLGPHRRHTWQGKTFEETISEMSKTICEWEQEIEVENED